MSIVGTVTGWAKTADLTLHRRLGRPYAMMLNIGLMADIAHRVVHAPEDFAKPKGWIGTVLAVAMEVGLLLHQLGEMSERLGRRHEGDGEHEAGPKLRN